MNPCDKCGSDNVVSIQYSWDSPQHYDGVSEYMCRNCGFRKGRWTGFALGIGEVEPRHGQISVMRNGKWKFEDAGKPVKI